MYSILFEIKNGCVPTHKDYGLELFIWAEIMEVIDDLAYVKGITIWWFGDDEWFDEAVHSVVLTSPQLTYVGLKFLEENSLWNNTYDGIANVNEWLEL